MPEHVDFEKLVREIEPTADESVPPDVREMIEYGQHMMECINKVERRTGKTSLTARAKSSVSNAIRFMAIHHAIGGREE